MAYIFSWRDTLQRINFLLFGIIARKMIWQKKKNAKNADGTKFFAGIKYIQKIVFIILYTNIKMLLHSIDVFVWWMPMPEYICAIARVQFVHRDRETFAARPVLMSLILAMFHLVVVVVVVSSAGLVFFLYFVSSTLPAIEACSFSFLFSWLEPKRHESIVCWLRHKHDEKHCMCIIIIDTAYRLCEIFSLDEPANMEEKFATLRCMFHLYVTRNQTDGTLDCCMMRWLVNWAIFSIESISIFLSVCVCVSHVRASGVTSYFEASENRILSQFLDTKMTCKWNKCIQ